jgi:hypothetical protein
VTLTASVPAGFAPYTYSWSNGSTANAVTVSPITTMAYTVTIKNAFGCATSVNQIITVKDIRDSDKNKVFICHNGNSISVSVNAVPAHLAHGDLLGNCEPGTIVTRSIMNEEDKITNMTTLTPNPANDRSFIRINPQIAEQISIVVYDVSGKTVINPAYKNLKAGNQLIELNTSSLINGVYFVQIKAGHTTSTLKLLVLH